MAAQQLSSPDRDALLEHRQAQQDLAQTQLAVSRLDVAMCLHAALRDREIRTELADMITTGKAEALKEYVAWKAEQERQTLERERAQAQREFG